MESLNSDYANGVGEYGNKVTFWHDPITKNSVGDLIRELAHTIKHAVWDTGKIDDVYGLLRATHFCTEGDQIAQHVLKRPKTIRLPS